MVITVKLTGENLLPWTMQLFPCLRSQKLMGYIDGTRERPLPTITEGEGGDDARSVANPVFEQWYQQDQLVLSAMLSSLGDTVRAGASRWVHQCSRGVACHRADFRHRVSRPDHADQDAIGDNPKEGPHN